MGNWARCARIDPERLADVSEGRGIRLLINESAWNRATGADLLVTGLDDLVGGTPDLPRGLSGAEPGPNQLVLAHRPAYRDRLAQTAAPDWFCPGHVLSGHTHGGQVTLFGLPPFLPRGSGWYLQGWYRDRGGPAMYVSRGWGRQGCRSGCGRLRRSLVST